MSKTTKILLKRSTVAGKAPTADIMESGEAFVNLAKGTEHLYFKNAANEVIATKLGPLDKELNETSKYGVENQAIAKKYNELKKQLDLISSIYSIYGFARINGETSPNGAIFFGKDSNLEEITSHVNMGLTTRDGKLYKRCANCRLDIAVDGTELKIDGTDGDVMLFTDSELYFLKATVPAPPDLNLGADSKLNIIALGMSPFTIYGVNAKPFDPFAFNPQYTVNCRIDGVDDKVCAHSIYDPNNYAGSYFAPYAWLNERFKSNGNGYPHNGLSLMHSIWYAQGKNADQKTNRPYMGGYYEFYEIFIALMFCELKSVYHQDLKLFGSGCTALDPAIRDDSFGDVYMNGNSGVMFIHPTRPAKYAYLTSSVTITNGSHSTKHPIECLCGQSIYLFTEMLEPQRILNDIAKAGLINKIWDGRNAESSNCNVVFEYNNNGRMKVSNLNNSDLALGTDMVANHKYYQVRGVPDVKGMADGAMTAVINIYVKMTFKDGTTVDGVDYTGGYAVYKMSHPVYRGMCLADGLLSPMQGCYYVNSCPSPKHYAADFECAENVDSIPPQLAASIEYFGPITKHLQIETGLTKKILVHNQLPESSKLAYSIWAKKANYDASLFCYTEGGSSVSTGECAFLWNTQSVGNADKDGTSNGLPAPGRKCVNAVLAGCDLVSNRLSARSVIGDVSVSYAAGGITGRFSIPHLQL